MSESMKGGNITVTELSAPSLVEEGEEFEVSFKIKNGANAIAGGDPDCCGPGCAGFLPPSPNNGYKYEAWIEPGWNTQSARVEKCIGTTEVGTVDHKVTATLVAPSLQTIEGPGASMIHYGVKFKGSGKEYTDYALVSTQPADPGPIDDGSGGNGGNGSSGGSNGGGGSGGNGKEPEPEPDPSGGVDKKTVAVIGGMVGVGAVAALAMRGDK